jgi:hypothetical protein
MRRALLVLLFFICVPAHAEMTIETITLQHRTAEDVIGIVKPMVSKGGSISGSGYKLFIKSTPGNIEQVRRMIADIDVAPKQLLISVSLDRAVMQENTGQSARVTVQGKPAVRIGNKPPIPADADVHTQKDSRIKYDARLFNRAQTQRTPQVQTVRVSEGLWATIKTGQAIPIASRTRNADGTVTETYTYTAVASGFRVLPRVNGDTVTLMIRPQAQTPSATSGGVYNTTEMDTTVSGKLGEWIALGSVEESQHDTASGLSYRTQQRRNENNQIYVKVELLNQ